mgnify:CR=1 FL=1|tara:strand:+ start:7373 stop:9199 length:1827 start_codon:yes stop_codon:yes gene_type:complete
MSDTVNIIISAQTGSAVKGLNQVASSTQRVGQQVQNAQAKMGSFNKGVTAGGVNMRKFAMGGMQQAGYQIGDFAVQVANGTSKMQAFGQQAPQLLQIFGPWGAIVGAGVAIFAAFAVVLEKTKKVVVDTATAVERLNSAFDTLDSVNFDGLGKDMSGAAGAAYEKYKVLIEAVREFAEEKRALAMGEIIEDLAPSEDYFAAFDKLTEGLRIQRQMESQGKANTKDHVRILKVNEGLNEVMLRQTNISSILSQIGGKTRAEAAESLAIAIKRLKNAGAYTTEVELSLMKFEEQLGLMGAVTSEAKDAVEAEEDKLAALVSSSKELFYQDSALRMMNVSTAEMGALFRTMVTDQERRTKLLQDEDTVMNQLVVKGAVYAKSMYQGGRGGDPRQFTYMDEFRKQLAESEAAFNKLNEAGPKALKTISITANSELSPAMKQLKTIQDSVSSSFENGFMSMIDGTKSVTDAFRSMASEIIKELYRIFVIKKITGFISDAIGGMMGGGVTSSPRPPQTKRFAGGGYTGNGPRAGGLDGKGGFMAMMHPRESVIDHTQGQSSGGVTVVQNINVSTGVQQTVRAEIRSLMPQIANAAKAAVVDAKRRGGAYGKAFS